MILEKFQNEKENIRAYLHQYFLHEHGPTDSPFSLGDVDIFLQASPLTRSLMNQLQNSSSRGARRHLQPILEDAVSYTKICNVSRSALCEAISNVIRPG